MPKTPMDAIALLKADHRKVEELFEKYEKSRGKKAEIAHQICMELIIHTALEEEIFYPACLEAVDHDLLDEAQVEHDGAKVLIAEIEAGKPDDHYYDAKVKVLSEEIKHHVKEEEKRGGVFSQARDSDLDMKLLGEQMMQMKKQLTEQYKKSGLPKPKTRSMKGIQLEHDQPIV